MVNTSAEEGGRKGGITNGCVDPLHGDDERSIIDSIQADHH